MSKSSLQETKAAHTPGPWTCEPIPADAHTDPDIQVPEEYVFWIAEDRTAGHVLAAIEMVPRSEAETAANARLIAAAPDFYSAMTIEDVDQIIEGIENFVMGPVENAELDAIWQPYIDKLNALRAAILKADGR